MQLRRKPKVRESLRIGDTCVPAYKDGRVVRAHGGYWTFRAFTPEEIIAQKWAVLSRSADPRDAPALLHDLNDRVKSLESFMVALEVEVAKYKETDEPV